MKELHEKDHLEVLVRNFVYVWLSKGFFFDSLPSRTRRSVLPMIIELLCCSENLEKYSNYSCNTNIASQCGLPENIFLLVQKHELLAVRGWWGNELNNASYPMASNSRINSIPYTPRYKLCFFEIPIDMVAKQITLIDQAIFLSIPIFEFLHKAWERPRYCSVNDTTRSWIDRFNANTEYFITQILSAKNESERIHRISHIAMLGRILLDINNFMSAAMVTFALSHTSIKRLTNSWNNLPMESLECIKMLNSSMSHEHNYASYRKLLQNLTKEVQKQKRIENNINMYTPAPCIPNLLVHHKDIFYDDESTTLNIVGVMSDSGESLINLHRSRMIAKHLLLLHGLQMCKYQFKVEPSVAYMLEENIQPHLSYLELNKIKSQTQLYAIGKILSYT